jgi:hypothetical protein
MDKPENAEISVLKKGHSQPNGHFQTGDIHRLIQIKQKFIHKGFVLWSI